ncbi:MAG: outer membrane lipoprotein carrier protein LolA [Alphaproteobacteria bacterium]|nr:outer membrane lipoprotein carrier protein LolA [Alphaproteobacteria bacterium]
MRARLLGFATALLAFSFNQAFALDADAREQVQRVERYLNTRSTFSSQFIQTTDSGQTTSGTLLVSRPGKMNLAYDPPLKDFIIADGSFVYMWDGELGQSNTLPLGGSLADLFLRANLKLSGDVQVTKVSHEANRLEVTVRQAEDSDQGSLTLLFEDKPLIFRGWRIQDAQNRVTTIALQNVQENVPAPSQSFVFVPPKLGKNTRSDKPLNRR